MGSQLYCKLTVVKLNHYCKMTTSSNNAVALALLKMHLNCTMTVTSECRLFEYTLIATEAILDCAVCETVVMAVKKVLSNDKVDHDIVHIVEKSCGLLPAKYSARVSAHVSTRSEIKNCIMY